MSQIILPRKVRGIRDSIPKGYVIGRTSSGNGKAELIPFAALGSHLVATGVVSPPVVIPPQTGSGLFAGQLSSAIPGKSNTGLSTWLNQGTATETDSAAGMFFSMPANASANVLRGLFNAAPATPYTRTILVAFNEVSNGNGFFQFGWYDGTNKAQTISWDNNGNQGEFEWTNPTTLTNINPFALPIVEFLWFRLADDGTNFTMSYSIDGANFITIKTGTKAAGWLGAAGYNHLFVGSDAFSIPMHMTIFSYQ